MKDDDYGWDESRESEAWEIERELRKTFDGMKNRIPLLLFTSPGKNEPFNEATRQIIRGIRQLTDKVDLLEFELSHKMARKWNADRSPTLLFDPERYHIRWLGAPAGEEARTFVQALIMMGQGTTSLQPQARKILDKIEEPRNIKIFVSPTCPYCPQQAVNALMAAIEKPETVSLEIIDILANPDLADEYSAQSVPQTFADELLIAQGAQPEELFMLSLDRLEEQSFFIPDDDAEEIEADLVIVGGGPAGLTAGIYGARSGLNSAIIEKDTLGGQIAITPFIENYPGVSQAGGKTLVDLMVSHALEYCRIFQGEEVMEIRTGRPLQVTTNKRRFIARTVLLATGAKHRRLDKPGESRLSGRGVSYCSTCDGPLFRGRKVIMVGGGNSAVTEALHLKNIGVDVALVHRRDTLRAQEQLIGNLKSNQIPILFNTEVKEIRGKDRVTEVVLHDNKTGKNKTMEVNGVFVAVGYEPAVALAQKIGVELTPEGYIRHDARHRTNIPGIYSAGDVEGGYKQIVTAAGQGAEAALSIFEDLVNPYWKKETFPDEQLKTNEK
jgi:thioredoxin reductase (NADPH)